MLNASFLQEVSLGWLHPSETERSFRFFFCKELSEHLNLMFPYPSAPKARLKSQLLEALQKYKKKLKKKTSKPKKPNPEKKKKPNPQNLKKTRSKQTKPTKQNKSINPSTTGTTTALYSLLGKHWARQRESYPVNSRPHRQTYCGFQLS